MNVKEIIREAYTRIGFPRRQAPSGSMEESALRLLQGVIAKYNYDNLLNWTQNSIIAPMSEYIHIYDEDDAAAGEYNLYFDNATAMANYELSEDDYDNNVFAMVKTDSSTVYTVGVTTDSDGNTSYYWIAHALTQPYTQRIQTMLKYLAMEHIKVKDVAKINSIYVQNSDAAVSYELTYAAPADFDKYAYDANVYTYTHKADGEWIIQVKPAIAKMTTHYVKLNYNEGFEIDLNTELYIPNNYTELLIVALAHKLALQFPRLDDTQMTRLQNEVAVLVDNVRTPRSVDRMIIRSDYFDDDSLNGLTQHSLMSRI